MSHWALFVGHDSVLSALMQCMCLGSSIDVMCSMCLGLHTILPSLTLHWKFSLACLATRCICGLAPHWSASNQHKLIRVAAALRRTTVTSKQETVDGSQQVEVSPSAKPHKLLYHCVADQIPLPIASAHCLCPLPRYQISTSVSTHSIGRSAADVAWQWHGHSIMEPVQR